MIFVGVVVGCLQVCYLTNDSTGIVDFLVGGYPVPYVGIALSSILHIAYVVFPSVPWFGLALYTLQTFALSLWLELVWKVFRTRWLAAISSLVVFGFYLHLIVYLDFTATSIMLCMSGLTWACLMAAEDKPGKLRFLAPGIVFMLGMLVRPDGAIGALAYGLPVALVIVVLRFRRCAPLPEARRLALAVALFLLPAALNYAVDAAWRAAVRDPQQASYEAFNTAGTRLMHIRQSRLHALMGDSALLASVGWTKDDLGNLLHWEFLDERIYSPEAMDKLALAVPPASESSSDILDFVIMCLPPGNPAFPLLIAALPFFFYLAWKRRPEGIVGVILPVYFVALTVFMYAVYAFGYRIEIPYAIGMGFAALLVVGSLMVHDGPVKRQWLPFAACVCLAISLVGAGLSVRDTLDDQHQVAVMATRIRHKLYGLNKYFAGSVILVGPTALELNALSPLEHVELHFHPINLGWNTFSPRFYRQIGVLGIQHGYQLVDAMTDRPDTYVLGPRYWCENLLSYSSDSDRRNIRVEGVGGELFHLSKGNRKN